MSGSYAQGAYTVKYNAPARWARDSTWRNYYVNVGRYDWSFLA